MKHANFKYAGRGWCLGAVLAAALLAGCAGKSVPMRATDSGSPGGAGGKVSAGADSKGSTAAKSSSGASSANGAGAADAAGASADPSATGRGGGGRASGDSDSRDAGRAGADGQREGSAASAATANAAAGSQEDTDARREAMRRAEEALAAERARRAELDAAERARQAELDAAEGARQAAAQEAAERERRGRVETAANQVLIGENEKLQTLGGLLPAVLNMDDKGQFDFDSYSLSDSVKAQLDEIAARLANAPYDRLHVVGFTDRIGNEEYNLRLSEKRAWSVAGYLMDKGVPPYKLKVEGKGEAGSLVAEQECKGLKREALIECLQRDRRVELVATVKEYNLKVQ